MRILFSYPWLDVGGAPNTAITLAKGLIERGHDLFFFSKSGGIFEDRIREAGIRLITAPHDTILPHLYHLNLRAYRILSRTLAEHRIDVVHAFHPNSYFLALFAAPRRNIPVVLTVVWLLKDRTPYPPYPGRVIFVAGEFKDYALPLFGNHPREMLVLPNRLDLDWFRPGIDSGPFAASVGLPTSGWRIAFMSRIDSIKMGSLRHAVAAVEILARRGADVILAVAGDGTGFDELSALAARANENAGREIVRLLGSVRETPALLSWSTIVLGIGRCAFEGMACGKPTLVVGEKGFAGTVAPETAEELQYYNFAGRNLAAPVGPEALADEIERIMLDDERSRRLGAFARQHVMRYYDYRQGAERLERIYEESLRDPPLSARERARLLWGNLRRGYGRSWYVAYKLRMRGAPVGGKPSRRAEE